MMTSLLRFLPLFFSVFCVSWLATLRGVFSVTVEVAASASLSRLDFGPRFFRSFSGDLEDLSMIGLSEAGLGFSISLGGATLTGDDALSPPSLVVLRRLLARGEMGGDGALRGEGDLSSSSSDVEVSESSLSSRGGVETGFAMKPSFCCCS